MDDQLFRRAKEVAARTGRSLNSLIEDALRESLGRSGAAGRPMNVRLKVVRGRGVRPGADLDDSATLLDLMEGR